MFGDGMTKVPCQDYLVLHKPGVTDILLYVVKLEVYLMQAYIFVFLNTNFNPIYMGFITSAIINLEELEVYSLTPHAIKREGSLCLKERDQW